MAAPGRPLPAPLEALPEPVLGIVNRRQACYRLD
jgi:hypothetical protein